MTTVDIYADIKEVLREILEELRRIEERALEDVCEALKLLERYARMMVAAATGTKYVNEVERFANYVIQEVKRLKKLLGCKD